MINDMPSLEYVQDLILGEMSDARLETLARTAHTLTLQRFGRTIKLYAPIYISNVCINGCRYCGFNSKSEVRRKTLNVAETLAEADAITSAGHRHILLVAGEDPTSCPITLIEEIGRALRPKVACLTIETQAFDEAGYRRLVAAGFDGVTLYQETYNEETYTRMHPYGPKGDFNSRLRAIDAAGSAGMRFLGIGALLGLSNWRDETIALIAHARWLMKRHWRSFISVSVPRIRDSAAGFTMPSPVSDRELVQIICTLRLALPDCGIVLSTREPAELRDRLFPLGITQMSAGSVTRPGGYTSNANTGEQFHLEDDRLPNEVARMLKTKGYDPVWKDWDAILALTI